MEGVLYETDRVVVVHAGENSGRTAKKRFECRLGKVGRRRELQPYGLHHADDVLRVVAAATYIVDYARAAYHYSRFFCGSFQRVFSLYNMQYNCAEAAVKGATRRMALHKQLQIAPCPLTRPLTRETPNNWQNFKRKKIARAQKR